jgi:hypothetical protein
MVAWSSLALQAPVRAYSAVARSCLAALLAHSAALREQLRPSPALSIAVQRSLPARVRLRAQLVVGPEQLGLPWAPSIVVQRTPASRESLRAQMHLPVQALPEARSAAVDSYPLLDCFVAG